jgi:hypothetical protein
MKKHSRDTEFPPTWPDGSPMPPPPRQRAHTPERMFLPTLSDLVDRLSIVQLKPIFIPEHREEYSDRTKDFAFGLALHNRKRHLDVQPASALV